MRDSNSFPGAFGLAVRAGNGGVRHFLIEPAARGVRLRGCADEPVFSSLSALVYQHTVTPLALPVPLRLPDRYLLVLPCLIIYACLFSMDFYVSLQKVYNI